MYQKFTIPHSTTIKCFILAHRQGDGKKAIIQRCHAYLSPKIQQNTRDLIALRNQKRQRANQAPVNAKEAHQIEQILSIQTCDQILSLYEEAENLQGTLGK
ncbi:hypothetical protein ACTQZM_09070 [Enterococcus cecorum]|uniref:hypothetical protein n=1 Tax=Enterococcus cecorum TaxID=44008 RepID=UPI003F8F235D